ncbi:hypothetical protein Pmani_036336 [Petrolisthes manimaculis]|uniref:Uncharacterized protein n=1 Tax=Petrolisthes manimaculis TaxID=1843537 RepID=A0AAE1TMS7_9EUCA|nr:hypothetical protein Pmani_036336 [Petrolisthes manimaculis]
MPGPHLALVPTMVRVEDRPHLLSSLAQRRPSTLLPPPPQQQPQPLTPTTQRCTPRQRRCHRIHCIQQRRWRSHRTHRCTRTTTPCRSTRGCGLSTAPTSPIPRGLTTRLGLCSTRITRPIISDAVAASVPADPPLIHAEAARGMLLSTSSRPRQEALTYLPSHPERGQASHTSTGYNPTQYWVSVPHSATSLHGLPPSLRVCMVAVGVEMAECGTDTWRATPSGRQAGRCDLPRNKSYHSL